MSIHLPTSSAQTKTIVVTQTLSERVVWQVAIVSLVLFAFCLGFPQFHYTAALMIAAILRYKDTPGNIFAPAPVG